MAHNKMKPKTKEEKSIREACDTLADKIAELWSVDRNLAPRLLFFKDEHRLYFAEQETEFSFPGPFCLMSDQYFDEFGELDTKFLMEGFTYRYLENANACFASAFGKTLELFSLYELASGKRSEELEKLAKMKSHALRMLGVRYSEEEKERITLEFAYLKHYNPMVVRYTCLCLSDLLKNGIDFRESADYLRGNIRDSCPDLGRIHGTEEEANDCLVSYLGLTGQVDEHFGNLMGQRLYDYYGRSFLPALVRMNADEARDFIKIFMNSSEIDSTDKMNDYFTMIQERRKSGHKT